MYMCVQGHRGCSAAVWSSCMDGRRQVATTTFPHLPWTCSQLQPPWPQPWRRQQGASKAAPDARDRLRWAMRRAERGDKQGLHRVVHAASSPTPCTFTTWLQATAEATAESTAKAYAEALASSKCGNQAAADTSSKAVQTSFAKAGSLTRLGRGGGPHCTGALSWFPTPAHPPPACKPTPPAGGGSGEHSAGGAGWQR